MGILNSKDTLIIIVDIQEKLLNATFNKEILEKKAVILSKVANLLEIPVVVTEQYPTGLGETVSTIKESLAADSNFFEKVDFSALRNKNLVDEINKLARKQVVIFGIETHICVNQTVESLIGLGFDVHVVKDACGSRTEIEHNAGLDRIKEHGANLCTTEIALFEWLKTARNPKFKEVQSLIK